MSLGERAVTHQIAHSPREPMSLLLTMGFHSRQHIPPPRRLLCPRPRSPHGLLCHERTSNSSGDFPLCGRVSRLLT